jgi:hypothetical protein
VNYEFFMNSVFLDLTVWWATLKMETVRSHIYSTLRGDILQKAAFRSVTAVWTSNVTWPTYSAWVYITAPSIAQIK